jgi:hypothetical protein
MGHGDVDPAMADQGGWEIYMELERQTINVRWKRNQELGHWYKIHEES